MLQRIECGNKSGNPDIAGQKIAKKAENLGFSLARVEQIKVYTVEGLTSTQSQELIDAAIWHDPILQIASNKALPLAEDLDWIVEISFRPGVTDNEGSTAKAVATLFFDLNAENLQVYTATQYRIAQNKNAKPLTYQDIERLVSEMLCNTLIQRYRIKDAKEWRASAGFEPQAALVKLETEEKINAIDLNLDDAKLAELSRSQTWALNLEELHTIRDYFAKTSDQEARAKLGLPKNQPTDAEIEVLAQTWSEHCKHKIFAAKIKHQTNQYTEVIDSLYKTYIQDTTKILRSQMGEKDYCRSVFKDNAGVIAFTNSHDLCIKVETHNSPSALDPYGGALTGIVGVNRDPLGTGLGADLICNLDVFCFASPFYDQELPKGLLHPSRIFAGVREGVEHGGNKSGIPTVNGSIVFDERYLGKPLVFCGTVGLLPAEIDGQAGWQKQAQVGDYIIMLGGRIGKDGIHGATFSSEALNENSPATAVQIGDPVTQRKMYDFLLLAREQHLYNAITDNGAGGLSSSVGEMAQDTNGCKLDLTTAPLKYSGLQPWEILISEAQERMTLAVPEKNLATFLSLAKQMDVEASVLGQFTNSGFFEVSYKNHSLVRLQMDFLHNGHPQLQLKAKWQAPKEQSCQIEVAGIDQENLLYKMLERLNICSKESVIRQYDHEVRGGSVIKPLVGINGDAPADAAVLRPLLESDAGIVLAHGICPKFSDYDPYWMMANCIDEAIRNAVAVGADPDALAGVDNFCWCDPIASPSNPDGEQKLAMLVRACKALQHFCLAYGLPCISGKDSMKNDYSRDGIKISIPPTVLFSVLGVIRNVVACQTSDLKQPGDLIYILGGTWKEMAGSELASELGLKGGRVPKVDASSALTRYRAVHALIGQKVITACHDCSDGGVAVALAEMAIGGQLGVNIDLNKIPCLESINLTERLYSESASRLVVSVKPEFAELLDILGKWQICQRIGIVTVSSDFYLHAGETDILRIDLEKLTNSFKKTLKNF